MTRIQKLEELQRNHVDAWKNANSIGVIDSCVGSGKTFVAFKALLSAKNVHKVLYLYPKEVIRNNALNEIKKFNQIYSKDLLNSYSWEFRTYLIETDIRDYDFIIADEIHNLGQVTSRLIYPYFLKEDRLPPIIGLSGTLDDKEKFEEIISWGENQWKSKRQFFEDVLGIVSTYTIQQGVADGILSPYNITVIDHFLSDKKTIEIKPKNKKAFKTSESANYRYLSMQMNRVPQGAKKIFIGQRTNLMYNLPSKKEILRKMLDKHDRMLIFGERLTLLKSHCEYIVEAKTPKEERESLIQRFNSGEISYLASTNILSEGLTLNNLQNILILSYNSGITKFIQRIGRSVRFQEDKIANVFIVRTAGTSEAKWFDSIREQAGENINNIISSRDL